MPIRKKEECRAMLIINIEEEEGFVTDDDFHYFNHTLLSLLH
jgi:hypothetical protein